MLKIPVVKNEKTDTFIDLENEPLAELEAEFIKIDLLIIDEFSLLGQIMFGKIDRRLRQAKNKNVLFGGISVILIGDPGQLLPVGQSTLYDTKLKNNISQTGYIAYQ